MSYSQEYLRLTEEKLTEILNESEVFFLDFEDFDFTLKYYKKRVILKTKLPRLAKKKDHKKRMKHILAVFKNHPKIDFEESEEYTDDEYLHTFTATDSHLRISISEISNSGSKRGKNTTVEIYFYKDYNDELKKYLKSKDLSKTKNGDKISETEVVLSYTFLTMIDAISDAYKYHFIPEKVYPFNDKDTVLIYHPYTKKLLFDFKKIESKNHYESKVSPDLMLALEDLFHLDEYYTKKNYRAQLTYRYNLKRGQTTEEGQNKYFLAQNTGNKSTNVAMKLYQKETNGDWYLSIQRGTLVGINNNLSYQEKKVRRKENQIKALAKVIEKDGNVILHQGAFPKDKKLLNLKIKSNYYIVYIIAVSTGSDCRFNAESSTYTEWETGNAFINNKGELIKEMESETNTIGGDFNMLPKEKLPAQFSSFKSFGIIGMNISNKVYNYSSYTKDFELFCSNCSGDAYYFVYTLK